GADYDQATPRQAPTTNKLGRSTAQCVPSADDRQARGRRRRAHCVALRAPTGCPSPSGVWARVAGASLVEVVEIGLPGLDHLNVVGDEGVSGFGSENCRRLARIKAPRAPEKCSAGTTCCPPGGPPETSEARACPVPRRCVDGRCRH